MTALSDRYELGRLLGAGGMGAVHEAHDRRLGRRVAVKLLRPGVTDPSARARFVREVQVAAAFTHPNVVTLFDVGVADDGRPYYVMELVDGRTLHDALTSGPLPVDEAVRIGDGVLAGLAAAHARGLVHRDVKPANVLLAADGSVKLTDFGIAKAVHDVTTHLTATGQLLGTPAYLAPEQVAGEPSTPATDVYAAGVVLYEMLAGAPPFRGDTPIATALQHRQATPVPLAERRPEVPSAIERVVARALEKEPAARYGDAEEMRLALAAAARAVPGAEPTLAHVTSVLAPPTEAGPGARAGARNPRRWVPAALVGVPLALALLAGAFALGAGGDGDGRGRAAAAEPTTSSSTSTSTSTTTTTVATPRTLPELAAVLAGRPTGYGPRGPELLAGLLEILGGDDEDGDAARGLHDDVPEWAAEGDLDPEIAGLAQRLLVPYLEGTDDPGTGKRDPGNGQGKGKEKDKGDD